MVNAYIEQSKQLMTQLQQQLQNQTRTMLSGFQFPGFTPGGGTDKPSEK